MTPQESEQLLEVLDRIEYQPEAIFIRQDDGKNVALSELPTLPAIHYVCEFMRKHITAMQGLQSEWRG